jgi:hypothetical protein
MRIFLWIVCTCFCLQGCVLGPLVATTASTVTTTSFAESAAVSGASYVTTGKGVTDHLISGAADQDCKLYNIIDGKKVCQAYQSKTIPQRDLSKRPLNDVQAPQSIEEIIQINQK